MHSWVKNRFMLIRWRDTGCGTVIHQLKKFKCNIGGYHKYHKGIRSMMTFHLNLTYILLSWSLYTWLNKYVNIDININHSHFTNTICILLLYYYCSPLNLIYDTYIDVNIHQPWITYHKWSWLFKGVISSTGKTTVWHDIEAV